MQVKYFEANKCLITQIKKMGVKHLQSEHLQILLTKGEKMHLWNSIDSNSFPKLRDTNNDDNLPWERGRPYSKFLS
jgi:hypothetical protein